MPAAKSSSKAQVPKSVVSTSICLTSQCTKYSPTNFSQCRIGDCFARVNTVKTHAANQSYNPSLSTHFGTVPRHNRTTTEEMQRSTHPHVHVLLNANGVLDKEDLIDYMSRYVTKTSSETESNDVENVDEEEELVIVD